MESYSAIKKNDIVKFSGKCIEPGKNHPRYPKLPRDDF